MTIPAATSQQIEINQVLIQNGRLKATVLSSQSLQNTITLISLTALVVKHTVLSDRFVFYQRLVDGSCPSDASNPTSCSQTTDLSTGSNLVNTLFDFQNCIITPRSFTSAPVDALSKGMRPSQSGTALAFNVENMQSLTYDVTCLIECQIGFLLHEGTSNPSTYQCYLCNQTIIGCQTCSSPTTCTATCAASMPGCTSCTSAGACTSCSKGFPLDTGCSTTEGCLAVTYVQGVSQCTQCSNFEVGVYSPLTHTCFCSDDPTCITCASVVQCQICSDGSYL